MDGIKSRGTERPEKGGRRCVRKLRTRPVRSSWKIPHLNLRSRLGRGQIFAGNPHEEAKWSRFSYILFVTTESFR